MKLKLSQQSGISETEVEIRYAKLGAKELKIINYIEQSEQYIYVTDNGRQYRVLMDDIFYAESVDRKTFIYTKDEVFRCELKLYQILDKLKPVDFVQVNKSCILNINTLDNIKTLLNSKMQGTLTNGEKITISRTYIPTIKAAFAEKEEVIL